MLRRTPFSTTDVLDYVKENAVQYHGRVRLRERRSVPRACETTLRRTPFSTTDVLDYVKENSVQYHGHKTLRRTPFSTTDVLDYVKENSVQYHGHVLPQNVPFSVEETNPQTGFSTSQMQDIIRKLEIQLEAAKDDNRYLTHENRNLKIENRDLKSENSGLRSENMDLKSVCRRLVQAQGAAAANRQDNMGQ
ncbi:hypothetical protein Bbelb_092060 [Branchiostoma belcheri]|nr:hypothetical protein Bbelb_092060 [Branchiostoma belcheri]